MKKFMFIFFVLLSLAAIAQDKVKTQVVSNHSVYIKGEKFEGVIFNEKYKFVLADKGSGFTPSANEVILAERLLSEKLGDVENRTDQKVFIIENLKSYRRQYVGYFNEKGEKVIYINLFWKKNIKPDWLTKQVDVLDGGHYYWKVSINLTTSQLFNFYVNGEA